MAYLTQTGGATPAGDLTNALGNPLVLQLFGAGDGTALAAAITDVITRAESVVDGYLCGVYPVPLTTGTQVLKTIATDVACYYAYARKPEFFAADGRNPWSKQYDNAMKMLGDLRDGKMRLNLETAPAPATVGGVVLSPAATFIVDPDEGTAATGGF